MIHAVEYLAVVALATAVRLVPMTVVRAWGTTLGRLAFVIDRNHKRQALENLAAAFPERSRAEHLVIAAGCSSILVDCCSSC